jgi:hypothetical protein
MSFAVKRNGTWVEQPDIGFQTGTDEDAVNHPPGFLAGSTVEELLEYGVLPIRVAEVPDGMVVVSRRLVRDGGEAVEIVELAPAPVADTVPTSVTPRQLRLALLAAGKLGEVTAFVGSGAAPEAAVISWEYATEFLRSDPMLGQFAAMLGLTDEDVDALFIAAAQIQ